MTPPHSPFANSISDFRFRISDFNWQSAFGNRHWASRIRHSSFVIPRPAPRGAVLLVLLFLMAVSVPLVCVLLEAQTTQTRITHNVIGDVTALYVAEAGVHDAISQLRLSSTWRTGFTNKEFPTGLGHTYTVTLVDDPPGKITVTSTSKTADGYSKTVTAVLGGF